MNDNFSPAIAAENFRIVPVVALDGAAVSIPVESTDYVPTCKPEAPIVHIMISEHKCCAWPAR